VQHFFSGGAQLAGRCGAGSLECGAADWRAPISAGAVRVLGGLFLIEVCSGVSVG